MRRGRIKVYYECQTALIAKASLQALFFYELFYDVGEEGLELLHVCRLFQNIMIV